MNKFRHRLWRGITFWRAQLFGWMTLMLAVYLITPNVNGYKENPVVLLGFATVLVSGIFSTGILRRLINHFISIEHLDFEELLKLTCLVLFACFVDFWFCNLTYLLLDSWNFYGAVFASMSGNLIFGDIWIDNLLILLGWTTLYMLIKIYLASSRAYYEKVELEAALIQAKLDNLSVLLSPHFMFNSLNNIRGLMNEDSFLAGDMLDKLSQMLQDSIEKRDDQFITLESELEMVDCYMGLSKIQFEGRLTYIKEIDPLSLSVPIPPLILQVLFEHAMMHGISKSSKGGTIMLKTKLHHDRLSIEIRNTGELNLERDFTKSTTYHIMNRLSILYANRAKFSLKESKENVVANFTIPLNKFNLAQLN